MLENYILDHHDIVPEPDSLKWARWMETADVVVARTDNGIMYISTVFLGIDHNFQGGPPLVFETMTFLTDDFSEETARLKVDFTGLECWRWSIWEEADAGHWSVVQKMFRRLDQFKGPIADVIKRMRVDTPVP
ncbi:hypothetical protein HFO56_34060 [Rhizobium laguerreae]|uniref:hypothetical protein n=1 Tax=Rhizobium laguerreae TaxID=1076926 RepID=UPI001C91FCB5|nr:hypothetical protein [Rhizobium laguerreae]MBY3157352.1 hypothetical protein [Rhizobium laguerreae]